MNRLTILLAIALLPVICASCNYSKYPIDKKPLVKVDEGLYGIWKVKSDTDRRNFILIQDGTEDGFKRKDKEHEYYVTYYNHGGINRGLENFSAFISDVQGTQFVNVSYVNWGKDKIEEDGYILFRILDINKDKSKVTFTLVDDPDMKELKSSAEVRARVTKQLGNPRFYTDTMELYSVAKGHFTKGQAVKRAN
jgi:hypothetical protein